MAPKGIHKGKRKATTIAKILTSVIDQRLSPDRDRITGFILEHITGLIYILNICRVKDWRAWDELYDRMFLDPVSTHHFSQLPIMWPYCRTRCSLFREWWAAFPSYMGQMFDKTRHQMNNWRWDNPCTSGDQVDCSNQQTPSSVKFKPNGEPFPWCGCDDPKGND